MHRGASLWERLMAMRRFGRPVWGRFHPRYSCRAFTLLETLMAVMLLSAMTLFAVPMYRDAVARSHRVLAIDALRASAWALAWQGGLASSANPYARPQHASRHGREDKGSRGVPTTKSAIDGIYRIVQTRSRDGLIYVRATPLASGPMHGDACGTYELGSNGVQGNFDIAGQRLVYARQQACWHGRG